MKYCCTLLFLVAILFTSCVIEKRHYRCGFYVNWNSSEAKDLQRDSVTLESPSALSNEELTTETPPVLLPEGNSNPEAIPSSSTSTKESSTTVELPATVHEEIDEPKPEGHDRLNPRITPMIGVAFVLPISLLLMELLHVTFSNPYLVLIGLPLLAALIFAIAMQMRRKYATLKSIGDKREVLRTSAHFHRYQVMLYIYFAAALMFSLGIALSLSTSGILGWIGVVFVGGGMSVGLGAAVILLVLFALYWMRWRKDPTGIKPPRDPHPPKDR